MFETNAPSEHSFLHYLGKGMFLYFSNKIALNNVCLTGLSPREKEQITALNCHPCLLMPRKIMRRHEDP